MNGRRNKHAAMPVAVVVVVAIMLPAAGSTQQQEGGIPSCGTHAYRGVGWVMFYLGDWSYSETYEKSVLFPTGGQNRGSWTAQVGPQGNSIIHAFISHGTQ